MKLRLPEFAQALGIPVNTAERWIRQGRMPVRKKGDQCFFNRTVLEKWADTHHLSINLSGEEAVSKTEKQSKGIQTVSLHTAMDRGGVVYDMPGGGVREVLSSAVGHVPGFDSPEKRHLLFESLMARENLMSTGIGKGVAIPHPRTPLRYADIPAVITTCFLKDPVDYHAVDQESVFVLFLLISPSAKLHLHLLARLSFCLRDESFLMLLHRKPDQGDLLERIAEFDRRLDAAR